MGEVMGEVQSVVWMGSAPIMRDCFKFAVVYSIY